MWFWEALRGQARYLKLRNVSFARIEMPFWIFAAVLLPYPAVAFIRGPFRRYRRQRKGLCVKCGYDLTGNVSGTCPECAEKI